MNRREVNPASLAAAVLSGFGMLFSTGPIVFATFALFMLPMSTAFGWGRGEISLALVVCSGCAALADPVVGRLMDRWGARRVLLPGLAVFAAANAALALVGPSLPLLYGLFALVGASSACCAAVPYSKVLSSWFEARRGLVLGVSLGVGAGLGSALIPQITRLLIEHLGWRAAHLGLGGLILFVALPVIGLFLRERGAASTPAPAAVEASAAGASAAAARRDPTFWIMFLMLLVGTPALAGAVVHLIALLRDHGVPTATATTIYSTYAIANILGHVLIGVLQDRIASPRIGLPVYACAFGGLILLSQGDSLPVLWAGALLLGLGFGAEVSLGAYWVARYWGLRSYGEIFGLLYCAASAGAAVGPVLMGVIFDRTGSYDVALTGFMFALTLCAALNLMLRAYPGRRHSPSPEPSASPADPQRAA